MILFTPTPPDRQGDRVRLFPSREAARRAGGERPLFAVALRVEAMGRRVVPTRTCPRTLGPGWTAPAYADGDGSVTVRAPIPDALFVAEWGGRASAVEAEPEGTPA